MELVRELLLKIEAANVPIEMMELAENDTTEERYKLSHHLRMLVQEVGFVRGFGSAGTTPETNWFQLELSWQGYEFLDSVRDPEIWRRTKEGMNKAGTFGVDFAWQIAKAYGKHVVKERLGLEI
jgi:hypothetical protein